MDANLKRAAVEWLKKQHAERMAALAAPNRPSESPRRASRSRSFDAVYNEIAGLPS